MRAIENVTLGMVIGFFIFLCVMGLVAWADERRKYRQ